MSLARALTSLEIREIGEALYGSAWQGTMARALGVPRQSVSYYLKAGVSGAQAAAIIGLIARVLLQDSRQAAVRRQSADTRNEELATLLAQFEAP
jgi:hypothetical protein